MCITGQDTLRMDVYNRIGQDTQNGCVGQDRIHSEWMCIIGQDTLRMDICNRTGQDTQNGRV